MCACALVWGSKRARRLEQAQQRRRCCPGDAAQEKEHASESEHGGDELALRALTLRAWCREQAWVGPLLQELLYFSVCVQYKHTVHTK